MMSVANEYFSFRYVQSCCAFIRKVSRRYPPLHEALSSSFFQSTPKRCALSEWYSSFPHVTGLVCKREIELDMTFLS